MLGLQKSILNRNGQTINYTYDSTNRLKTAVGPFLSNTFSYNNNDLPTQIQDINGTLSFVYDSLSRLISYSDYYTNQVQYEYDNANNLKKIIYPGNLEVQYNYDDDNLLHTVTDWLNQVSTYFYLDDGRLSRVDLPNGTFSTYSYDDAGRLTGIENSKSDGTIICSYVYTLDSIGNHTAEQVLEPLDLPEIQAMDISYTYDDANRIQQAGSIQFSHDFNGNLKSAVSPEASYNYSYNTENKLSSVGGTFNASFVYDAMGNRRTATRNGVTTRYVLDISGSLDNVLEECDASNTVQYYYIHGAGLLYRIKATDNSIQCYHYDSRGSTIAITDASQEITHKYVYDDFGQLLDQIETDFNPYRYVGKYGVMYEDSLLYFMRARYYRPDIGRFLSEDPVWNTNLFVYGKNNPIVKIDPAGQMHINLSSAIKGIGSFDPDILTYGKIMSKSQFKTFGTISKIVSIVECLEVNYDYINGNATLGDVAWADTKLIMGTAFPVVGLLMDTSEMFNAGITDSMWLYKRYLMKRK